MDQLFPIARKRRHVIEQDQCVNKAFLMERFRWADARGPGLFIIVVALTGDYTEERRKPMSSRKIGIALGSAGAIALSASMPSMASMPTAVATIKTAPSLNIIDVRWSWWPGIGVGVGLGFLGAAIAAPYY